MAVGLTIPEATAGVLTVAAGIVPLSLGLKHLEQSKD